jgi:hypothetical protein
VASISGLLQLQREMAGLLITSRSGLEGRVGGRSDNLDFAFREQDDRPLIRGGGDEFLHSSALTDLSSVVLGRNVVGCACSSGPRDDDQGSDTCLASRAMSSCFSAGDPLAGIMIESHVIRMSLVTDKSKSTGQLASMRSLNATAAKVGRWRDTTSVFDASKDEARTSSDRYRWRRES